MEHPKVRGGYNSRDVQFKSGKNKGGRFNSEADRGPGGPQQVGAGFGL